MADFLDARQRAMLAEMGVSVWERAPETKMQATTAKAVPARVTAPSKLPDPDAAQGAKPVLRTPQTDKAAPARTMVAPGADWADVSHLNWDQLEISARQCQDCGLCAERQTTIWGQRYGANREASEHVRATVLVITDPPDSADEAAGLPLGGEQSAAGSLLHAMLSATGWISTDPAREVFVTPVTKCKVPVGYKLTQSELMACRRYLVAQIQVLKPQLILTLGRVAALTMLAPSPDKAPVQALGQLRGTVHEVQGHPMVASLAPQYLLRNPLEKAKAWEDLCLALAHLSPHP